MKNKISSNKGGSLVVVILAIALVGITSTMVFSQITNQIRLNKNQAERTENKIIAESGIELGIAEYIDKIEIIGDVIDYKKLSEDLALLYSKESNYIFSNKGQGTGPLNDVEKEISNIIADKDNSLSKDEVIKNIEDLIAGKGLNGNPHVLKYVREHLQKSIEYLELKNDNLIKNICKNIEYLKEDLKLDKGIGSKKIGVLLSGINEQSLKDVNNIDIFISNIDLILNNWKDEFSTGSKQHYGGTNSGNIEIASIGKTRLEIVKKELILLKGSSGDGSTGEDGLYNNIKVKVPKNQVNDTGTVNVAADIDKKNTVGLKYKGEIISQGIYKYEFDVEKLDGSAKLEIPLIVKSRVNDEEGREVHNIDCEINLVLRKIISIKDYQVEYSIKKWND